MLIPGNILFRATLLAALFIGPSDAAGKVVTQAPLTAAPSVPYGFAQATNLPTPGSVEEGLTLVRIDPTLYVEAAPRVFVDRPRRFWLIVTAALTLLLASLSPRWRTRCVVAIGLAWTIGLGLTLARRPAVDRVTLPNGNAWLLARKPTPWRLQDGWRPVVESLRHARALEVRRVEGEIRLILPAAGARVLIEPVSQP